MSFGSRLVLTVAALVFGTFSLLLHAAEGTSTAPKAAARKAPAATFSTTMKASPGFELEPKGTNAVVARQAGGATGSNTSTAYCTCSGGSGACSVAISPDKTTAECKPADVAAACKGTCQFSTRRPSVGGSRAMQ